MNTYKLILHIFSLACAVLILSACETSGPGAAAAPPPNSARLIVNRVANFGSDMVLVLSIDGKDVATLTEGNNYNGFLTAGQHTMTARVDPFQAGTRPTKKMLTIQAGQTYNFTASWSGQRVVFVRNP
jgi:hypothetical protein